MKKLYKIFIFSGIMFCNMHAMYSQNNVAITNTTVGQDQYTKIPLSQVIKIANGRTIENLGTAISTNTVLTVTVTNSGSVVVYTESSTPQNLAVSASVPVVFTGFTPTVLGNYTVNYTLTITENDTDTADNVKETIVEILSSTYARDNDIATGALGLGVGSSGQLGQEFDIVNSEFLTSVTFQLGGSTNLDGETTLVNIWDMALNMPNTLIGQTEVVTINGLNQYYTANIAGGPLSLAPGKYVLTVEEKETQDNITFSFTSTIYTPGTTWVRIGAAGAWGHNEDYGFPVSYILRANLSITPATHLNFDGVNDYVSIGTTNLPVGASARTIEAMVKTNVNTGGQSIINYGNQGVNNSRFGLSVLGGTLYFVGESNDYATNINIADNNWHHVAATYDGYLLKLYIDGALVATQSKTLNTNNNIFNIGASCNATPGEFFNGSLDEVRVWNKVLTATDIMNHMNCELQSSETGLVAYYKFNQGNSIADNTSITTLTDASGNANNGTLTNFARTGTTSNFLSGSPIVTGTTCTTLNATTFEVSNHIKMYPNPTNNFVTVEVNNLTNAKLQIVDITGKILMNQLLNASSNNVDIQQLPSGMYFFKVTSEEGTATSKIIKN